MNIDEHKISDSVVVVLSREYDAMLEAQNGRCAICGRTSDNFHLDHDHTAKAVRGILCQHCNQGLGHFKDNPDWLDKAKGYLQSFYSGLESIRGWVEYELLDADGQVKQLGAQANLVTEIGDKFYGDRAANIRTGASATITAVTNVASPVFTATAHGLGVGDVVTISGATPAGYNGSWVVTAVTANTFTVYVGTALGAGSAFNWSFIGNTVPMASGMRVGTGTTAVAKTGAGAAIVTYATSLIQFKGFDSTFPTSALSGSSRRIQYKTTFNAGEATQTALAECVITTEQPISDVAGTAANTISRALLSPTVSKGSADTLAITWNVDLLGS